MTEPTEPLPCPFCGSARIGVHKYKQRRAVGFRARCLKCGMSQLGMCHGDHEQAVAAWNTRTPQPTQAQAGAAPLADEMQRQMKERCDSYEMRGAFADGWLSAEAAHGIKGGQHGADT